MVILPFQSQLSSLISGLVERIAGLPVFAALGRHLGRHPMRLEDEEQEGRYEVRAEIPGVDPANDVDITVSDGWLTIKAERAQKSGITKRSEFYYGSFERSVPLPDGAEPDGIATTYDKGVLTVAVPVSEAERTAEEETEALDEDDEETEPLDEDDEETEPLDEDEQETEPLDEENAEPAAKQRVAIHTTD